LLNNALEGPWLNFNEVEKKTGLVTNEVLYKIECGELSAVVHCSNRPFLAASTHGSHIIGHACFRYAGPLALSRTVIQEIIRESRALAKVSPTHILQPLNIIEWESDLPYFGHLPNGVIHAWEPKDYENILALNWHGLIFPEEMEDYSFAESSLADWVPDYYDEEDFFERFAQQIIIQSPNSPLYYATHINSDFNINDLRIPQSSLAALSSPNNIKKPTTPSPSTTRARRTHELYAVIEKAMIDHPAARSGTLWNLLRNESFADERRYDQDNLIDIMDNVCIEWTSASGVPQVLKKSSFQTAVSKLRKSLNLG